MGGKEHVSEHFARLLALYRGPDGSEWGGQDLEDATGGSVTRSYVSNPQNGLIGNPGLAKLEAIAGAMGFPPQLWFGAGGQRVPDDALVAALEDATVRAVLEGTLRLGRGDRELLLRVTCGISSSPGAGPGGGGA